MSLTDVPGNISFCGQTSIQSPFSYGVSQNGCSQHDSTDFFQLSLGAQTRFFDVTPVGQIVNRMSRDTKVVDSEIGSRLNFLSVIFYLPTDIAQLTLFDRIYEIAAFTSVLIAIASAIPQFRESDSPKILSEADVLQRSFGCRSNIMRLFLHHSSLSGLSLTAFIDR